MVRKVVEVISVIPRFFNVLLLLISPMALLMLVVGFIMLLDTRATHNRLRDALELEVLTAEAEIASCYPEDGFCFAKYVDVSGADRYDRLDTGYYPGDLRTYITMLEEGDEVVVRYSMDPYETEIVLAEHYEAFVTYKGYYVEMAGMMAVSWFILILHPEILLAALVDDFGTLIDAKWKRVTGLS